MLASTSFGARVLSFNCYHSMNHVFRPWRLIQVKPGKRIPLGDSSPLADNPLAALGGVEEERLVAASGSAEIVSHGEPETGDNGLKFSVEKTRKGGWPVLVEKRRGSKTVTVLDRVSGDTKGLLKHLRQMCSAGGSLKDGRIEIQGNHVDAIRRFLDGDDGGK